MGPDVGVGQGMELGNRALPMGASADGAAASKDGPRRRFDRQALSISRETPRF